MIIIINIDYYNNLSGQMTQLNEQEIDFLIESIIESDNLVFDETTLNNIKRYKLKIVDILIDNDYVETITKLKKIFISDSHFINYISELLSKNLTEINLKSIEWLINNESDIFDNSIKKMTYIDTVDIINCDNFISIHKLIKSNLKILNTFENKIIEFLNSKSLSNNNYSRNYDSLIIITDIFIKRNTTNNNIEQNKLKQFHLKIINTLLNSKTHLETIIKYKNNYKISDDVLKGYFEDNFIFENCVKYSSVEIINWFFEIASLLVVIKPTNYKNIFKQTCMGGNLEVIKLVYNLIQCAGYILDKLFLQTILHNLIAEERWNSNNNKKNEEIIFEFINMDIKPIINSSKYSEYYKNIKFINK